MNAKYLLLVFLVTCVVGCKKSTNRIPPVTSPVVTATDTIVDCKYSFDEAIKGSKAPDSILAELELIAVHYYSFDGKIHRGQLLLNKKIAGDVAEVFQFILESKFPVAKVIPVVKYKWDDTKSMNDNNSYSFCYRNVSYSKHARGMAVDINPQQNPVRWNKEFREIRTDKPRGAVYNPSKPGTFYPEQPVVLKFKEKGFFWGRNFSRNDDDHHFEK